MSKAYLHNSDIRAMPAGYMRNRAYFDKYGKRGRHQDSLAARIDCGMGVTEDECNAAVAVLGARCRAATKMRLYWAIKACPSMARYGIYERLYFHEDGQLCSYCAGQDYTAEIRTVRELLLGRRM